MKFLNISIVLFQIALLLVSSRQNPIDQDSKSLEEWNKELKEMQEIFSNRKQTNVEDEVDDDQSGENPILAAENLKPDVDEQENEDVEQAVVKPHNSDLYVLNTESEKQESEETDINSAGEEINVEYILLDKSDEVIAQSNNNEDNQEQSNILAIVMAFNEIARQQKFEPVNNEPESVQQSEEELEQEQEQEQEREQKQEQDETQRRRVVELEEERQQREEYEIRFLTRKLSRIEGLVISTLQLLVVLSLFLLVSHFLILVTGAAEKVRFFYFRPKLTQQKNHRCAADSAKQPLIDI